MQSSIAAEKLLIHLCISMKTINLKGKEYAPVSARVEQFHKDHEKGSIETGCEMTELQLGEKKVQVAKFKATVSYDKGTFNGHAFGSLTSEKAFEKLESVAVGRALAFAGYLAGGEIASYEEIRDVIKD